MRQRTAYIILLLTAFLACACTPEEDTSKIVWLCYHENGSAEYPLVHYDLTMQKDSTFTLTNTAGRAPEEALQAAVPAEVADSLASIVEIHDMLRYRDYYQPLVEVKDGISWHLSIHFDDETAFSSAGYAARPTGEGLQRLHEYLDSVWVQVEGNAKIVERPAKKKKK